ncbi:Nucleolar protein 13 [Cyberlindnera fabianii]|uniref:Nucleolar protein 13 n=1 Tax=Cyberlindnera fabianii TaxID=36022 RepID=A0A1V2L5S0_CYBFA|nr:Nucleolar protein 13 [Cyberlindnera fabianii]
MSDSETSTPVKEVIVNNKKRSLNDEIEIDLTQTAPLSKKQKRLLRKGKLDLTKLEEEQKKEAERLMKAAKDDSDAEGAQAEDGSEEANKEKKPKKEKKEEKFGVWIGNMSFDTLKEDLTRFIVGKTTEHSEYSSDLAPTEPCQVKETDILRLNMPSQGGNGKVKKIKGFAYVDFPTKSHQLAVLQLSETQLNGRNLLIKDSKSFEGRPSKEEVELSKNPPSRILFVGNLSFDTTEDMLTQHFQHCGEIIRIRMATFQDTGKCKGFAFLDFKDEEGPTKALKDKSCRKLLNRPLRMEFGEDRSKRTPKNITKKWENGDSTPEPQHHHAVEETHHEPSAKPIRERSERPKPVFKKKRDNFKKPERQKSSVALASAQRASAAIVPSAGKKTTFG